MKIFRLELVLTALWIGLASADAASVKVIKAADGTERVCLENDLVRVQVNPSEGARVDSFQCKAWGATEIIAHPHEQGLFADHFWQEYWPGQLWAAKYDYRIVSAGPGEAAVKFSYLSQDKGVAQVAGILVEKTISLRDNDRFVRARIQLTNKTTEGRYLGYWQQNVAWLGGDMKDDWYFRPGKHGVSRVSSDDANPPDAGFVRDPQAGWSAAIDGRTKTGLVFLMDYNYLWFLYNCTGANTMEWQYDAVAIPPGKTWQTEVSLLPIAKLEAVSYASEHLLASVTYQEDKAHNRLEITETYQAAGQPLPSLAVQTGVEVLPSGQKPAITQPGPLHNLGFEPRLVTVSVPYDTTKREPAVVRLAFTGSTATGAAFTESTELWYPGAMAANANAADGAPFYAIKSAMRQKTLLKPDRIVRIVKPAPQVLFLKGLLAPDYKLEPALQKVNAAAQIKDGFAYTGVFGPQLDYFPYDYDTLMSCDLVVLGDLSAAGLGDVALEMLKDYCEHGGNLLVLPGPAAYGNGGYQGTVLATVLPVACHGAFDLRAATGDLQLLDALAQGSFKFAGALRPEYLHEVKAKPGARVLMSCGGNPVLTMGKFGAGKVCCLTAPPLGDRNFCDTPQWQDVLVYVLRELGLKR